MSEARLWDPWQINHPYTAGPKIVLIQLGTERTVASVGGSFRPLREPILTDRGGLSSVPETGRTLPFPFSHGPVSLSLPTRIYGHFLSLSHCFLSVPASLIESPSPHRPKAPTLSHCLQHLLHSQPSVCPPVSPSSFSSPFLRRQPHKQEVVKRKRKRRGVCGKAFAPLEYFPVTEVCLVCVLDTSGWNPGPSSWNSPTTVLKTAGTQFRA